MRNLDEIRVDIDAIDKELIELFKRRMDCAKEVGLYKQKNGIPVLNRRREEEILDRIQQMGGEYGAYARLLYQMPDSLPCVCKRRWNGTEEMSDFIPKPLAFRQLQIFQIAVLFHTPSLL